MSSSIDESVQRNIIRGSSDFLLPIGAGQSDVLPTLDSKDCLKRPTEGKSKLIRLDANLVWLFARNFIENM